MNLSAHPLTVNGKGQLSIPVIGDTGQRVVPGHESGEETKVAAGLDNRRLGGAICCLEIPDGKQEEGHVKEEEEQEEGKGGAQGAHHQDSGEDEPASEEETEGIGEVINTSG